MSQEYTDGTKLGPGFEAVGDKHRRRLGLPERLGDGGHRLQLREGCRRSRSRNGRVLIGTESAGHTYCGLAVECATGPSTAAAQNPGDTGSDLNENLFSGANVAETTASGFQTPSDVRHPIATSRRGRSKSPYGRTGCELSPRVPRPWNYKHIWQGYGR